MIHPAAPASRSACRESVSTGCGIVAHGVCESSLSGLRALRDAAAPAGAPALPPRFLRHADEHTVVGVHAVLAALSAAPAAGNRLGDHGIVGAPCQAGRISTARSLVRMRAEGAVAIPTHIVPQCSLHSVAGAVSVALGMHGPHVGVGGGPDALAEGLFTALSLVHAAGGPAVLPAVWLVATEWDTEPMLDGAGDPIDDPVCRGLALLLEPGDDGGVSLDLRRRSATAAAQPTRRSAGRLAEFARAVSMCHDAGTATAWTLDCPWSMEVRIERRSATPSAVHGASSQREAA